MVHNYYNDDKVWCIYTINTTNNYYKAWPYSSSLPSSIIFEPQFLYNSNDKSNSSSYSNYLKSPLGLKSHYVHFMNVPLHPYIIGLSNINASHLVQTYKHTNSTTLIQNFSLLASQQALFMAWFRPLRSWSSPTILTSCFYVMQAPRSHLLFAVRTLRLIYTSFQSAQSNHLGFNCW